MAVDFKADLFDLFLSNSAKQCWTMYSEDIARSMEGIFKMLAEMQLMEKIMANLMVMKDFPISKLQVPLIFEQIFESFWFQSKLGMLLFSIATILFFLVGVRLVSKIIKKCFKKQEHRVST